jgi:hypothetical protein
MTFPCTTCGKTFGGKGQLGTHAKFCGVFDAGKFWSRTMPVPWTGCWLWTGAANSWGYGTVSYYGNNKNASRVAWMITHGEITEPGIDVLHTCNVRLCCNPGHMYLGTDWENARDRVVMGSYSKHVTPEQVRQIRALLERGGMRGVDIAYEVGVDPVQVSQIKTGKNWSHIV